VLGVINIKKFPYLISETKSCPYNFCASFLFIIFNTLHLSMLLKGNISKMKCPTPGCDKEIDEKDFIEYISKEKKAAMKVDALKEADKEIKEKETEIRENAKKEAKREYKETKDLQNKKHEIERKKWIDKFYKFQEQLDHQNPELKGEAQQQQIEDFLKDTFPNDDVDVIKKGENGADIIFTLFNKTTKLDPIYIESKNTASFSTGWPKKTI